MPPSSYADWTLEYPGESLSFGSRSSGLTFTAAPDLGSSDIDTDDVDHPTADGQLFGADRLGGGSISFELFAHAADESVARSHLARIRRAWRGDAIRSTPGAVATLQAPSGRLTYGRPRRLASEDSALPQGVADITADFTTATDLWYGPEEVDSIDLTPAPGGGLIAPLAAPLATTESSDRSRSITVTGEMPAWPVIEIEGPITNPVVEIGNVLRLEFRIVLAYDHVLVVDTRPFARTILRNGASVAGSLTPTSTRLSMAAVPPGSYEFVLRGSSSTGTARATVRHRPTFLTP